MSGYLSPLRFARVFEMDRNGPPMCGTLDEQQQVRDAILTYAYWDGPYDRALYALTRQVKAPGDLKRYFLPISLVHDEGRRAFWGRCFPALMQLFPPDRPHVPQSEWDYVVSHEMAHFFGWRMFNPVDRTEGWATQFQWWVMNGQPESGWVYERLAEAGCQETVTKKDTDA